MNNFDWSNYKMLYSHLSEVMRQHFSLPEIKETTKPCIRSERRDRSIEPMFARLVAVM